MKWLAKFLQDVGYKGALPTLSPGAAPTECLTSDLASEEEYTVWRIRRAKRRLAAGLYPNPLSRN